MPLRGAPLLALLIIVLGATIRMWALGGAAFSPREVAWITVADRAAATSDRRPSTDTETAAPLPRWMTQLALRHGYGEVVARLPSALAGTAALLAMWLLALRLFGSETAVYATLLLACSPLHVGVSRAVGSEPWLTLALLVTVLALCLGLQRPQQAWRWLGVGAAACIACVSGFPGLFVPAALVVVLSVMALRGRRLPEPATAVAGGGVIVACIAAWAIYGRPQPGGSMFPVQPSVRLVLQVASFLATGGYGTSWPATTLPGLIVLGGAVIGALHAGRSVRLGGVVLAWAGIGIAGVVGTDLVMRYAFEGAQVAFALPGYLLLCAAGATWLRQRATARASVWGVAAVHAAIIVLVLLVELPGLAEAMRPATPRWREATAMVRANAQPGDTIVVLLERATFAFYAPDLEPHVEAQVRLAFASAYFVHPDRGWLIAPAGARLYGGWPQLGRWLKRFPPVDLGADPGLDVVYTGHVSRSVLLFEVAFFELPVATLARGTLLIDLLVNVGPIPPVLWKVDQLALSRGIDLRNSHLLEAVSFLAEHDHGDRAASLAYRLATAEPDWPEAQQALAAFEPAS